MKTLKDCLFVLIAILVALTVSFAVGIYRHPEDEVLMHLATNRTLICIFYVVWLFRTTRK